MTTQHSMNTQNSMTTINIPNYLHKKQVGHMANILADILLGLPNQEREHLENTATIHTTPTTQPDHPNYKLYNAGIHYATLTPYPYPKTDGCTPTLDDTTFILLIADLITDENGNTTTFTQKLADITEKYGRNSVESRETSMLITHVNNELAVRGLSTSRFTPIIDCQPTT